MMNYFKFNYDILFYVFMILSFVTNKLVFYHFNIRKYLSIQSLIWVLFVISMLILGHYIALYFYYFTYIHACIITFYIFLEMMFIFYCFSYSELSHLYMKTVIKNKIIFISTIIFLILTINFSLKASYYADNDMLIFKGLFINESVKMKEITSIESMEYDNYKSSAFYPINHFGFSLFNYKLGQFTLKNGEKALIFIDDNPDIISIISVKNKKYIISNFDNDILNLTKMHEILHL